MDVLNLLGLIVLSAVISTAEIGFFAVNSTKLRALAQSGNTRAKLALHLRSDPQKLLSTILVGDRLVGVATPMYATFLTLSIYGGQTSFDDAMNPRLYVFSLDGNLCLKEAQELLYNSKYSRIPVYDTTLDNITGILYKTRALTELAKGKNESKLKDIAYPPLFVPSGKTAD